MSGLDEASIESYQARQRGANSTPTILSHLLTLPSQTLLRLYSFPSNSLAIFRLLSPLARHLILILLFLPDPPKLPSQYIVQLFRKDSAALPNAVGDENEGTSQSLADKPTKGLQGATGLLSKLGIIKDTGETMHLNGVWTSSLRRALVGG